MFRSVLLVLLIVSIQISQSLRPSRRFVPQRSNVYRRLSANEAEPMIDVGDQNLMDELEDNEQLYDSLDDDLGNEINPEVAEMVQKAIDASTRRARLALRRSRKRLSGSARRHNNGLLTTDFEKDHISRRQNDDVLPQEYGRNENLADESPESGLYSSALDDDLPDNNYQVTELAGNDVASSKKKQISLMKDVLESVLKPDDSDDVVIIDYDNRPPVIIDPDQSLNDDSDSLDPVSKMAIGRRCDTCGGPKQRSSIIKKKNVGPFRIDISSMLGIRVHAPNGKGHPRSVSEVEQIPYSLR